MASTTESLRQALEALNHNTDRAVQRQADTWLQQFQQSTEAWQVADALLHDAAAAAEVHYFCAQTLKKKAQKDFEQLPAGAPASLRDSVMVLLLKFAHGMAAVRTQLCLALVALVAHMGPDEFKGLSAVQWLAARFAQENQQAAMPCLLEVLVILPQESRGYPSMWPQARRSFARALLSAAPDALSLLSQCLQVATTLKARATVIEGYGAWVRLGGGGTGDREDSARTLPSAADLAAHPLTAAALQGLACPETFDACVDTVSELIRSTRTAHPEADQLAPDQLPLVQLLVPTVMTLLPRFQAASRASADIGAGGDSADDDETAKGMARLFSEVGEAYVGMFATATAEVAQPVEALLEVVGYPEDSVAFMSFEFWHQLSGELTNKGTSEAAGQAAAETARRASFFKPAFVRLIQSIQGRVKYPDGFEEWNKEQKLDFKKTRYAVADTLLDAATVLGAEECLDLLVKPLAQLSQNVAAGAAFDWREAEAAMYCIRSVARASPAASNSLMAGLLAMLPTLPKHPLLVYTSCLTVANYAEWLCKASQAGNASGLMPVLLQLLMEALTFEEAAPAASLALRHLCDACSAQLGDFLDGLMQLYQAEMKNGGSSSKLDSEDLLQVIQGLCTVISTLPTEQVRMGVRCMLEPLAQRIEAFLGGGGAAPTWQCGPTIDRITCVLRHTSCPQVVAELFVQLWPVLQRCFAALGSDERATERLCRAIKYALRGSQGAPECLALLPPLAQTLRSAFPAHKHASYLFAASETIRAFGGESNAQVQMELQTMVDQMVMQATLILQKVEDFSDMPDVADDLFLMGIKCLTYAPHLLLTQQNLPTMVKCALAGMLVQHKEACCSILEFLEHLMRLSASHPSIIPPTFQSYGQALTNLIICAAAGGLPFARLDEVGDVLTRFLDDSCSGGHALTWLQATMTAIPALAIGDQEKMSFYNSVITRDRETIQRALDDLADVCRRNRQVMESIPAVLLQSSI